MSPKLKNILVVVLTAVIGAVVISGGYFIWRDTEVIQPINDYLNAHEQVKDYHINERENELQVVVKLEYSPFLDEVYLELYEGIHEIQGDESASIEIANENSAQLNNASYQLSYLLKETIYTGEFTKMWEKLQDLEREHQLDHIQVHLLDSGFFIQMKQQDNYLVEKIEYTQELRKGESDNVDSS